MLGRSVYALDNVSSFPEGRYVYCFCFPEDQFFALVNAEGMKTYWLGLLNSSSLGKKAGKNFVMKLYLQYYRGFTIRVITRALYVGITDSLKRDVTTLLTENPCIKYLFSNGVKLGIAVKSILKQKEGIAELKKILQMTESFCLPASCGCNLCEELGGTAVLTFIGSKEIC